VGEAGEFAVDGRSLETDCLGMAQQIDLVGCLGRGAMGMAQLVVIARLLEKLGQQGQAPFPLLPS
jgi:hypothetical protein